MISSLSDSAEEKFRNSIIVLLTESDLELLFVFYGNLPHRPRVTDRQYNDES